MDNGVEGQRSFGVWEVGPIERISLLPTWLRVTVGNKLETCLYHRGHSFLLSKPLFHGLGFIEILCGSPMRSELPTTFINDSASPDLILRGTTTPTNILSEPILRFRFSKPISRLYRPPLSISARVYYVYGKNTEYPAHTGQNQNFFNNIPGESHHSISRRSYPNFSFFPNIFY